MKKKKIKKIATVIGTVVGVIILMIPLYFQFLSAESLMILWGEASEEDAFWYALGILISVQSIYIISHLDKAKFTKAASLVIIWALVLHGAYLFFTV